MLVAGFVLVGLAPALRLGLSTSGTEPTREECAAACDYVVRKGVNGVKMFVTSTAVEWEGEGERAKRGRV